MSLSRLFADNPNGWKSKLLPRLSWKCTLAFCVPIGLAGVTFLAYYLKLKKSEPEIIPETPLEAALALKLKGNKFFKGGQYDQAIHLYDEGLKKCPLDAVQERAAFYQNRAAAKENQRLYESAIEDCSQALTLTPQYLKALNRRAHLYEKVKKWDQCLLDMTACCIFEKFKNPDSIVFMDQVLKTIGQKKAEEERSKLSYELPSASFIRNYMSAFACDTFTVNNPSVQRSSRQNSLTETTNKATINGLIDEHLIPNRPNTTTTVLPHNTKSNQYDCTQFKEPLYSALINLNLSLECLTKGDYQKSADYATKAVDLFESILLDKSFDNIENLVNSPASSPEVNTQNHAFTSNNDNNNYNDDDNNNNNDNNNSNLLSTETNNHNLDENTLTEQDNQSNYNNTLNKMNTNQFQSIKIFIKEAYNQISLLHATYQILTGRSKEAKERLQQIGNADSGASIMVRVNALIKSACLAMTVDQDVAACLYDFQRAQNIWPECSDIYLHRGQINLLSDQLDEALHDLNTAVKLKPEFSVAQAQRLYAQYRYALNSGDMNKVDSRIDEFRRLIKKYPNCLETHSLFAQVLSEHNDYKESDKVFADLIALAPDSGLAYAHRGLLQLKWKQDRDAALCFFLEGVQHDPKCELLHELLGQLAVEKGEFQEALKHFNMAIQQAKSQNDLAHMIALREGVSAQLKICEQHNLSIRDVITTIQEEQQRFLMAMQEKL
ncbi:unnamed protein product [Schistosoma turkestanicum]|nr:unnamed protein product [Schistosoma turkestanicum]